MKKLDIEDAIIVKEYNWYNWFWDVPWWVQACLLVLPVGLLIGFINNIQVEKKVEIHDIHDIEDVESSSYYENADGEFVETVKFDTNHNVVSEGHFIVPELIVEKSIKSIDPDNPIIDGNNRWAIAKTVFLETLPDSCNLQEIGLIIECILYRYYISDDFKENKSVAQYLWDNPRVFQGIWKNPERWNQFMKYSSLEDVSAGQQKNMNYFDDIKEMVDKRIALGKDPKYVRPIRYYFHTKVSDPGILAWDFIDSVREKADNGEYTKFVFFHEFYEEVFKNKNYTDFRKKIH